MPRVFVVFVIVAATIYAVVTVAQAESERVRVMPKWLWAAAVILLPILGPVAWFVFGQPTGSSGGDNTPRSSGPLGPDDDPDFLRRL